MIWASMIVDLKLVYLQLQVTKKLQNYQMMMYKRPIWDIKMILEKDRQNEKAINSNSNDILVGNTVVTAAEVI